MTTTGPVSPRRRLGIDPRLIVGLALVVVSVAGVVALVGAADRRVAVYAASAALVPGERVSSGDLLVRQIALDSGLELYLRPGAATDEYIVTSAVRAGELVPVAALGDRAVADTTTIVVPLASPVGAGVVPGTSVDVWAAPESSPIETELAVFAAPVVLCPDAVVVELRRPEGIVGAADGDLVEVRVPRFRVARILQAIADGDALAVIPVGVATGAR